MSWLIFIGICVFGTIWLEIKRVNKDDSPPDE